MLFENLVSLIDGKLLNQPSISSFSEIVFDAKKVGIGSLFFGDSEDIDLALQNGAYGIVSDKMRVKDKEIAWIKVKDIDDAKLKLLRYFIIHHDSYLLFFDSIELELAKMLYHDKDILYISDIQKAIKTFEANKKYKIVVVSDETLFKKLNLPQYEIVLKHHLTFYKWTNFVSTFTYRENLYKDVKFSAIFQDKLERVLNCFDNFELEYKLERVGFLKHFKPIFLDKDFRVVGFGQSRKVFIVESEEKYFDDEIDFLLKNSSWAKIAVLLPKKSKLKVEDMDDVFYYKSYDDILKLDLFRYNFVIMIDHKVGFENFLDKINSDIKDTLF